METLANTYKQSHLPGYVIQYVNTETGYLITTREELLTRWKALVSMSFYRGDIALYFNGTLIRAIWNAQQPILKQAEYRCKYKKYSHN